MWIYILIALAVLIVVGIIAAVRRQANMTPSYSKQAQEEDARVFAESTKVVEATVAEALAAKARDPRLAEMTQEDLVYEVLKECYDPEIPLNVVDLGLIYEVKAGSDAIDVKISVYFNFAHPSSLGLIKCRSIGKIPLGRPRPLPHSQ